MSRPVFNEALLLKAGLPRQFVEALRSISLTIGDGTSIASVSELESLLLAMAHGRSETANLPQQIQVLSDQVAQISRQYRSDIAMVASQLEQLQLAVERMGRQQGLPQEIVALLEKFAIPHKPNLSELERRLTTLEDYIGVS